MYSRKFPFKDLYNCRGITVLSTLNDFSMQGYSYMQCNELETMRNASTIH